MPGADRGVTVTLSARDLAERPVASPPSAALRMPDLAMGPERIVLAQESPGFWRGSTRLSTTGRLRPQVDFNGESPIVPFGIGVR